MSGSLIAERPGLIPVGLSEDGRVVTWQDVGTCPFDDSFFEWSLESWTERHGPLASVQTELTVFEGDLELDFVAPSLFIFHMSRCGSTLLSRALARSPRVVCMSEVPALNQLLLLLCGNDLAAGIDHPMGLRVLRNFVRALGRRRTPEQQHYVVKFSSWNVMLVTSLRAAFPDVPFLFLYREPSEVIVSIQRTPTGFSYDRNRPVSRALSGLTPAGAAALEDYEFIGLCLQRMMNAALAGSGVEYIGYSDLSPGSLPWLLEHLGWSIPAEEVAAMADQFEYYTKAQTGRPRFVEDVANKQSAAGGDLRKFVEEELAGRLAALERAGCNLGARLRAAAPP